jgi:pimeloyl-ACP methyl ester carboxylesterase
VSLKRVPVLVATVTMHVVDPTRTMVVAGSRVARNFDVEVWYPSRFTGRAPLIVFGHGYAVTPTPYTLLLKAWAQAGYVVAAPVFPLENANAPGGPNESDLPNQPADMSRVISSLQSPQSPKARMIASRTDLHRVAVAGQSDGGDTALAAAYGPQRDPRIGAAVILSGAEDPFAAHFAMPADGPPLLAVQGTADTINPPPQTYSFFQDAARPKYLLKLLGASHLPPYTEPGHDLTMVEHVTLAFLNRYLKGDRISLSHYASRRSAGVDSVLVAAP